MAAKTIFCFLFSRFFSVCWVVGNNPLSSRAQFSEGSISDVVGTAADISMGLITMLHTAIIINLGYPWLSYYFKFIRSES